MILNDLLPQSHAVQAIVASNLQNQTEWDRHKINS